MNPQNVDDNSTQAARDAIKNADLTAEINENIDAEIDADIDAAIEEEIDNSISAQIERINKANPLPQKTQKQSPSRGSYQPTSGLRSVASVLISQTVRNWLSEHIAPGQHVDPFEVTTEIINEVNTHIEATNVQEDRIRNNPIPYIKRLGFNELAIVMSHIYHIINIVPSKKNTDPDLDMLAIYDGDPSSNTYGVYVTSSAAIRRVARKFTPDLSLLEYKELISALTDISPRVARGENKDLIAVNNGIVNYKDKSFIAYDELTPEQRTESQYVFLSKASVDYNPHASNPHITMPDGKVWDVESWMLEIADDADIAELLWQIIGAIIRPYVSWNKSAWLYSERGNNGKGTLVELMRNLCGPQSYASVPLSDFGKDFMLEPLTRANAILVDENDVGTFIDRAANLKAIITNDVITINRKHKMPVAYQFYGFMVQCLNEFPKIKDKSESFYRRQLFIPFTKSFTGVERRYIKDDYIARQDVLEYVLWRVIHMPDYYVLSEPYRTQTVLDEYREFNDPVRAFYNELESEFVWDLLPFTFLYDVYKAWLEKAMPSSTPLGRNTFMRDITTIATESGKWVCDDPRATVYVGNKMDAPEPLILEYDLQDWQNTNVSVKNPNLRAQPRKSRQYRGLMRVTAADTAQSTTGTLQGDTSAHAVLQPVANTVVENTQRVDTRARQMSETVSASADTETKSTGTTSPALKSAPEPAPAPITPHTRCDTPADTQKLAAKPGETFEYFVIRYNPDTQAVDYKQCATQAQAATERIACAREVALATQIDKATSTQPVPTAPAVGANTTIHTLEAPSLDALVTAYPEYFAKTPVQRA